MVVRCVFLAVGKGGRVDEGEVGVVVNQNGAAWGPSLDSSVVTSGVRLRAPRLAASSALSLPLTPEWLLTL